MGAIRWIVLFIGPSDPERVAVAWTDTLMASSSTPLRTELRLTTRLGLPLAFGELGWMSTYIIDALMVGHLPHSTLAISASSLDNTIYYALAFCAIRRLDGVMTLVAQAYGSSDLPDCLYTLAQSMFFLVLGTPLVMVGANGITSAAPTLRRVPLSSSLKRTDTCIH